MITLKTVILGLTSIALVMAPLAASGASEPLVLGLSAPITGANATWGGIMRNHVMFAVDEINAKGGVLNRPMQVIVQDNQSTVTGGIVAYQKMVSENPRLLAIVGLTFSNMVLGLMPYVKEEKTPCMVNASNPKITEENNGYMIRIYNNDNMGAEIATRFAYEKLDKKVAIMNNVDAMGAAGALVAKATLEKYYKVNPATWVQYNGGDKDFTGQLLKIKDSGAKAIVHWGHAIEIALVMKQMVALGMTDVKMIGSPDTVMPTTLQLAQNNADGNYCITNFSPFLKDPKVQDYVDRFNKRFGMPPDSHTGLYDGVYMVKAAIEKVGDKGLGGDIKAVRQRITDALFGMRYAGVAAEYYVSPSGDALWQMVIVRVKDGAKNTIEAVETFKTEPPK